MQKGKIGEDRQRLMLCENRTFVRVGQDRPDVRLSFTVKNIPGEVIGKAQVTLYLTFPFLVLKPDSLYYSTTRQWNLLF